MQYNTLYNTLDKMEKVFIKTNGSLWLVQSRLDVYLAAGFEIWKAHIWWESYL